MGISTCERCRLQKRRCDRHKPSCTRCLGASATCSFASSDAARRLSPPPHDGFSAGAERSFETDTTSPPFSSDPGTNNHDGASDPDERFVRKRNRLRLSCARCHQQKVKCDRTVPCSRCKAAGLDTSSCTYAYRREEELTPENGMERQHPGQAYASWHTRPRGTNHWRSLLKQIGLLSRIHFPPFSVEYQECSETTCKHSTGTPLPHTFPFGSVDAARYASLEAVIGLIRVSKARLGEYVDNYMRVFQPLYPIQSGAFQDETSLFHASISPRVDVAWLANYLMVLGLGCTMSTQHTVDAIPFMFAAEACLIKTPFMSHPTPTTIRALCLTVLAKQTVKPTCWVVDSCWSVLGLIVRLAALAGLHSDQGQRSSDSDAFENWKSNRGLWTMVVYLSIETATVSGMPTMIRPEEVLFDDDSHLLYIDGNDPAWTREQLLYRSFPSLLEAISRANSGVSPLAYEEIVHYDTEIRNLMTQVCSSAQGLQAISLDIFFRRILLVLHRQYAHHPCATVLFPAAYWSSLECSLALLLQQRTLWDESGADGEPIANLYSLDFFSAALTACIHLLHDAPLAPATKTGCIIPPRQTILETLTACKGIWERLQIRSLCHREGFRCLEVALGLLPEAG